mgnify:FL=1
MSLKETLAQDLKLSLKEKDLIKRNTVQSIRAAILQFEKDNRTELDDDGIVDVIAKELKKRKDVLPDYEKSGRQDLIDQLNREIEIVMGYLPSQLSEDELDEIVKKAVEGTGASTMKDMGKIMAAVMPQIKGRADGRAVNALAKKYLV